jgi:thiamine-phosphate pyrophosphorylase
MARCYSGAAMMRHPVPSLWLLSDARNDAALERTLKRLPRRSGFVFRHYHLPPAERRKRYEQLRRLCRGRGIAVVLAGSRRQARVWRADAAYGADGEIATAHSLRELRQTGKALAVMLSPVFPTRSHPGGRVLGPVRFLLLAPRSPVSVIALGGMTASRARALAGTPWAAIDGFVRR